MAPADGLSYLLGGDLCECSGYSRETEEQKLHLNLEKNVQQPS